MEPRPEDPGSFRARRVNRFLDRFNGLAQRLVQGPGQLRPRLLQRVYAGRLGVSPRELDARIAFVFDVWRRERQEFVRDWTSLSLSRPILTSMAGGMLADAVKAVLPVFRFGK